MQQICMFFRLIATTLSPSLPLAYVIAKEILVSYVSISYFPNSSISSPGRKYDYDSIVVYFQK